MTHVLVLGGTTEASALARALADAGLRATLSYAGRTERPRPQPVAVRVGGFGGVDGLAAYLRDSAITHVVDATHPFAATISANAVHAAARTGTPLVALTRPPWQPGPGDTWTQVRDIATAVAALDGPPQRVMLAIGRQQLAAFAAQPQHHYLLRLVDRPQTPPPLPHHEIVIDRGPFSVASDIMLLQLHKTERIVAKNAGGSGARAKLDAARALGIGVLMIDRPTMPARAEVTSVDGALAWLQG